MSLSIMFPSSSPRVFIFLFVSLALIALTDEVKLMFDRGEREAATRGGAEGIVPTDDVLTTETFSLSIA